MDNIDSDSEANFWELEKAQKQEKAKKQNQKRREHKEKQNEQNDLLNLSVPSLKRNPSVD